MQPVFAFHWNNSTTWPQMSTQAPMAKCFPLLHLYHFSNHPKCASGTKVRSKNSSIAYFLADYFDLSLKSYAGSSQKLPGLYLMLILYYTDMRMHGYMHNIQYIYLLSCLPSTNVAFKQTLLNYFQSVSSHLCSGGIWRRVATVNPNAWVWLELELHRASLLFHCIALRKSSLALLPTLFCQVCSCPS